jgi:hypothetical protein
MGIDPNAGWAAPAWVSEMEESFVVGVNE